MGRVMIFVWLSIAAVVVVLGFIRLAPSDPLDWNTQPELSEDTLQRLIQVAADRGYDTSRIQRVPQRW